MYIYILILVIAIVFLMYQMILQNKKMNMIGKEYKRSKSKLNKTQKELSLQMNTKS